MGTRMSNGKGDTPRPSSVDAATYRERYTQTFGSGESAYMRNRTLRATCAERGHPVQVGRMTATASGTTATCACGQMVWLDGER